jgi:hypothetical protein
MDAKMAKCIKEIRTDEVRRVPDDKAAKLVSTGLYSYISKSKYQESIRKVRQHVSSYPEQ